MLTFRQSLRVLAVAGAVLAAPVAAHTRLTGSSPAAGETAGEVGEVRLRFSQAPEASLTWLVVLSGSDTIAQGRPAVVPGSGGRELALALGAALPGGAYRVVWRTAGADGHVLRGSFTFTALGPAGASPVPSSAGDRAPLAEPAEVGHPEDRASPLGVLVRWLWFIGLLALIGTPAFRLGVLDRLRRRGLHEQVTARAAHAAWYLAAGAAALSLIALVLRLWVQAADVYGPAEALDGARLLHLLRTTTWGTAWALQAVATFGFVLGLFVARAPGGRDAGWRGAALAAVLLAAVPALSGHAAGVERATGLAVAMDALHVLGAGVWLGTLGVLMAAGFPAALSRGNGGGPEVLAGLVDAFSPVALAGGGLAGATGVVNALFHLQRLADLWTTPYGRTLALKLLLLAVVAAAGAHNWRRMRPALARDSGPARLRRSVAVELGTGALVVLVTAVLVALPTP